MIMVKGKGKKFTSTNDEDVMSGEEEKIPVQKKRGRPLKVRKEEINEDEHEKAEEKKTQKTTDGVLSDEMKNSMITENGRKRNAKGKFETGNVESESETRSSPEGISKPNGFRHNGSKRKSKPCRAAEAGVECQLYLG